MQLSVDTLDIPTSFVEISGISKARVFLKIEALNPAGSIKFKAARSMIDDLQSRLNLNQNTQLIESSSGNLGVALAMICAAKGIKFTCVVDPNISEQNRKIMVALGAEIVTVTLKDENGGYLGSRIQYIKDRLKNEPDLIWLNQYANLANPSAHEKTTAREISEHFCNVDYLFVGAGTTGTLMGCRNFFRQHRPNTRIVAVDSVGSVTFGFPAGKRVIPGLGTSRRPEIFDANGIYAVEQVPEYRSIQMCRWLSKTHGVLAGGSTGTVLAAINAWNDRIPEGSVIVTIAPDQGERYLDTIYNDDWVNLHFGAHALTADLNTMAVSKEYEVA